MNDASYGTVTKTGRTVIINSVNMNVNNSLSYTYLAIFSNIKEWNM